VFILSKFCSEKPLLCVDGFIEEALKESSQILLLRMLEQNSIETNSLPNVFSCAAFLAGVFQHTESSGVKTLRACLQILTPFQHLQGNEESYMNGSQ
jgi:hypothetical protein